MHFAEIVGQTVPKVVGDSHYVSIRVAETRGDGLEQSNPEYDKV